MRRRPSLAAFLLAASVSFAPLAIAALVPAGAHAQCIDEAIRDELNARRRYRGVQERLFQKAGRHELSIMGGLYSADLLSSFPMVQGAYTFHVTEDLGLEASFAYTEAHADLIRILSNEMGGTVFVRLNAPTYIYTGHLLWSLAYGKMRWFGSGISRFDFYIAIGGGVTDNQSARGLTFSGGFGLKFFLTEWLDFRLDVRDQVLEQQILGQSVIVNNILVTGGLSIFIPFTS